jgi:hypothetical protein
MALLPQPCIEAVYLFSIYRSRLLSTAYLLALRVLIAKHMYAYRGRWSADRYACTSKGFSGDALVCNRVFSYWTYLRNLCDWLVMCKDPVDGGVCMHNLPTEYAGPKGTPLVCAVRNRRSVCANCDEATDEVRVVLYVEKGSAC